jgi:nitrogen fixation NifU-like protein
MLYSEKVMEYFDNPRNVGVLEDANAVGEVGNAKCGDIMKMYMKINDDKVIEDVSFKTYGCGAAVATSSMATELIKGKTIDEAIGVTNKAVMEALDGLPPVKIHCSLLAEEAIQKTIADYYIRQGKEVPEMVRVPDPEAEPGSGSSALHPPAPEAA